MTAPEASPAPLHRLAHLHGVQRRYASQQGDEVVASDEALMQVLRSLGVPIRGVDDAPDAIRTALAEGARSVLPPVTVVWEGSEPTVEVQPGEGSERGTRLSCVLVEEEGEVREWAVDTDDLAERPASGAGPRVPRLSLPLPGDLPWGVHGLRVQVRGATSSPEGEGWVIHAPRRVHGAAATDERDWGVFLPLHALRTGTDWGVGDFEALGHFRRWAAARGARWTGTLPLLAGFLDEPFDPSPYAPVSRLFWNEIYLDPARAPELEAAPAAREILESAGLQREMRELRTSDTVDYRRVMRAKRRVLEPLAEAAFPGGRPAPHIAELLRSDPEVGRYARFRAGVEHDPSTWPDPPAGIREDAPGGRAPELGPAERYHLYVQWLTRHQLDRSEGSEVGGGASAGLYLDLPLGCHAHGFDPWRWPALFAKDAAVGAPPDALATEGQNWGFPPLRPQASRAEGHRYWRQAVSTLLRRAGVLRIDHVMALHRLFWIPEGMGATDGLYVRYPAEELYALLALESRRHDCRIVGENLGTVPAEVNDAMERHGLLKMYVLPFELGEQGPADPPRDVQASLNTHDTPTFAGFVRMRDLGDREAGGGLTPTEAEEERAGRERALAALRDRLAGEDFPGDPDGVRQLLQASLRFLAASSARLLLVNLEDLWLEERPQNVPGAGAEAESWRRRARYAVEELEGLTEVEEVLEQIRALRGSVPER